MAGDGHLTERVDGDDKHLRRTLERFGQGRWLGEIAAPHPHAALLQSSRLLRIADAHPDLPGGNAFEQPLQDRLSELSVGSSNDDHDDLQSVGVSQERPTGMVKTEISVERLDARAIPVGFLLCISRRPPDLP